MKTVASQLHALAHIVACALLVFPLGVSSLSAQPPTGAPPTAPPPTAPPTTGPSPVGPSPPAPPPALSAPPVPAQTPTCEIKGLESIKKAREKGFIFQAEPIVGKGTCHFSDTHFIVSASSDGPGVSCKLSFFGGRKLKGPWKITDVGFHGGDVQLLSPIASDQVYTLPISVRVSAETGKSVVVSIKTTALTGGKCEAWQNAF